MALLRKLRRSRCDRAFRTVLRMCFLMGLSSAGFAGDRPDLSRLPAPSTETIDYVRHIQPVLEETCYSCHGPERQKSGLRLDRKTAALKGGENGPVILPGNSAGSPLIHMIAGLVPDMAMPPRQSGATPLSTEQIGLLRAWIDQGASWPESADRQSGAGKAEGWAFRRPDRPALPLAVARGSVRNEIDQFVVRRLEAEGLSASPEADKRTLLRRLSFDLIGLPPTPEEMDRFLSNSAPAAYEEEVERLLHSPRYGERWARHWLDTVHFGETHGYDKDKTRPNAWPYRDYVIGAFNRDKPYARFVQEQLAGDVLYPDDPEGVVALGFIAAGPWDFVGHVELPESKTDGLIARYNDRDDMVMTTMSTFQSLTVHCARCHDHKFDPISQDDYYSLQAVFAGVDRADRWYDPDPAVFRKRKQLLAEKKGLEARQRALSEQVTASSPAVFKLIDARLQDLGKQLAAAEKAASEASPANGYHSEIAAQADTVKWVQVDLGSAAALEEIRLVPARPTDFADTPGFGFPVRFRVEIAAEPDFREATVLFDRTQTDYPNPGDASVAIPAAGKAGRYVRVTGTRLWARTGDFVFALAELQAFVAGKNLAPGREVAALDSIEEGRWGRKHLVDGFSSRQRLEMPTQGEEPSPAKPQSVMETELTQLRQERERLLEKLVAPAIRTELAEVEAALRGSASELAKMPPRQMVFAAASDFEAAGNFKPAAIPRPVHVLRRGEVKQQLRAVGPAALSCLPGLPARLAIDDPNEEGQRRAALARWLTDPQNLLTRRSLVNRVWQNHFGRGLVETPNDFGHMGAPPTHPELLDWLAYWFMDHGESIKALHRLIVTSATYRQSSAHNAAAATRDADNRLLWRMNRIRLDAEALHDALLAVSGSLDLSMGGPSVQQFFFKDDHSPVYDYGRFDVDSPAARRRSIYRFIVRSVPDPFMETMDCPDASLLAPRRSVTITSLQALALLNDPFVLRQAERFAVRASAAGGDMAAHVTAACDLALNRCPTASEAAALTGYGREYGVTNVCRLLFNTSEFVFVE